MQAALSRALEDARQRQAQVSALLRGSRVILESRDFKEAAPSIFDACKTLLGAGGGYISLLTEDEPRSQVVFQDLGRLPGVVDLALVTLLSDLRDQALRSGQVILENTLAESATNPPLPSGRPCLENVLFAPLIVRGFVVGLMGLVNKPGGFTDDDCRLAMAFAELVAIALFNNRSLEALRRAHDELEQRVEERTHELAIANEELRLESTVRRQAEAQVRAARERLQKLSRRLVEIQEAERRQVARELHDEAGQVLTSLIFGLGQLEQETEHVHLAAQIAELKQMTSGVLDSLHRLAMDLRPTILDHLGLAPALLQHVKATGARHGLSAQFKAVGLEEERLPAELETALYRIVQEALTNVVRHAQATRVDVLVERRGDQVVAVVEDNGQGFDADIARFAQQGHLGLVGMQERAEMLGGSLVVESDAGVGTTVAVEIPYGNSYPDRG